MTLKEKLEGFLNKLNDIEIGMIRNFQKIFLAEKLVNFHRSYEFLSSPKLFSFIPLLFFSLNRFDKSFQFAKCSIFYIYLSHKFKKLLFRKRPYEYPNIFNPEHVSSSSFPSNHSAGSVILASFFPFHFFVKFLFVLLMLMNRVILGCHFPTDTIAGAIIGLFIIFLSKLIENRIIIILILFYIFYDDPYFSWLFGSSLAFFVFDRKKKERVCWLAVPLSFLVFKLIKFFMKIFEKLVERYRNISLFMINFICYYGMMRFLTFIQMNFVFEIKYK